MVRQAEREIIFQASLPRNDPTTCLQKEFRFWKAMAPKR